MSSLSGTYKSKFDNFSLRIVRNDTPNVPDQFTFIKIHADGNEETLFETILQGGAPGTLLFWATGILLTYNTDFKWISINKAPVLGLIGDYTKDE